MSTAPAPAPKLAGRALRLVAGLVLAYVLVSILLEAPPFFRPLPGWRVPSGGWWWLALFCWLALPDSLWQGFGLRLGTRGQYGFVLLGGAAVVTDRLAFERLWGWPLALVLLLLMVVVLAWLSVSFLLAGALATPG